MRIVHEDRGKFPLLMGMFFVDFYDLPILYFSSFSTTTTFIYVGHGPFGPAIQSLVWMAWLCKGFITNPFEEK